MKMEIKCSNPECDYKNFFEIGTTAHIVYDEDDGSYSCNMLEKDSISVRHYECALCGAKASREVEEMLKKLECV